MGAGDDDDSDTGSPVTRRSYVIFIFSLIVFPYRLSELHINNQSHLCVFMCSLVYYSFTNNGDDMKRKQPTQMHPMLRAQLRAKWVAESVNAQIHALYGDNKEKLLAYGSVLMFVASACAAQRDTGENSPQFRIIRGAINALDDLKDRPSITLVDRGSIYAGLLASQLLIEETPIDIVDGAAGMYQLMEKQLERAA